MTKKLNNTSKGYETDLAFLIKAALYLLLGTVWVGWGGHRWIPAGVVLGFFISKVEALRIDRKIEYGLLVVGALLGLYSLGITIFL